MMKYKQYNFVYFFTKSKEEVTHYTIQTCKGRLSFLFYFFGGEGQDTRFGGGKHPFMTSPL